MKGLRAYDIFMATRAFFGVVEGGHKLSFFQQMARAAVRFDVNDAAACYRETVNDKGGAILLSDLPEFALPYEMFWMEWGPDSSQQTLRDMEGSYIRYAALCRKDGDDVDVAPFICVFRPPNDVFVDPAVYSFKLQKEWRGEGGAERYAFGDPANEMRKFPLAALGVVLFSLALMSAKNVTTRSAKVPRPLRRRPGQFSATVGDSFHVLDIPGAQAFSAAVAGAGNTSQKRLHIVRGHFADYTEGGGLFGKLHGRYYIAPHVRGNVERGTITKDYRLRA